MVVADPGLAQRRLARAGDEPGRPAAEGDAEQGLEGVRHLVVGEAEVAMPALRRDRERAGLDELGEVRAGGRLGDAGGPGQLVAVSARPPSSAVSISARAGSPMSPAMRAMSVRPSWRGQSRGAMRATVRPGTKRGRTKCGPCALARAAQTGRSCRLSALDSTPTSPPCARAISRTMNRPRPTLRAALAPPTPRVIGSNRPASCSRGDRLAGVVHGDREGLGARCARSPSPAASNAP